MWDSTLRDIYQIYNCEHFQLFWFDPCEITCPKFKLLIIQPQGFNFWSQWNEDDLAQRPNWISLFWVPKVLVYV